MYDVVYAYTICTVGEPQVIDMRTAKTIINGNLVRKQFLISSKQLQKLSDLSASKGKSEAEIVRLAIDAYNPDISDIDSVPELLELVDLRLKEAILSTQQAGKVVSDTLNQLQTG